MNSVDRYTGCLLALALGDAAGAPHEGGPLERFVWKLIGTTGGKMRWTDDTQMSLDLAESFIERRAFVADDVASRFARSYRWDRGYGPGTARLLERIRRGVPWFEAAREIYREGSFGNGAAMRSPVIGLVYASNRDRLTIVARDAASITHSHPLGIEGAIVIAAATAAAVMEVDILEFAARSCESSEFIKRFELARRWVESGELPGVADVRALLGNGTAALNSCVTAVYAAVRFRRSSFSELLDFAAELGGDVDTIGAMAGAIWGAANGVAALPKERLESLEDRERIERTARALADSQQSA